MNFKKRNEILQNLSSEESSKLGRINANLSGEKAEGCSSSRVAGKSVEKVTTSSDERSRSKESASFSRLSAEHGKENVASKKAVGKIPGYGKSSKEISNFKECAKENYKRHGKTGESVKYTISSESAERLGDEQAEYNRKVFQSNISISGLLSLLFAVEIQTKVTRRIFVFFRKSVL